MIPDREPAHAFAQLLDHASTLVPEHDRLRRMAPRVLVQVGVADAGGDEANAHLAGARLLLLELFDDRRGGITPADGS